MLYRVFIVSMLVALVVPALNINVSEVSALTAEQKALYQSGIYWYDTDGGASCGVGTPNIAPGSEGAEKRREEAYNYFVAKLTDAGSSSFAKEQSAGILGNLLTETGGTMDPAVEQGFVNLGFDPEVETGYGLAQWTSKGRKYRLQDFAEATGRNIDDFYMQLDFIWFEMTGKSTTPGLSSGANESNSYNKLILKETTEDAAVSWASLYERNADSNAYLNVDNNNERELSYEDAFRGRINNAEEIYASYSENAVGIISGNAGECAEINTDPNQCADGTIDLGINDTYVEGVKSSGKLCAVTNLPSSGEASTPGSRFYIKGSNRLAIVSAERSGKIYAMVEAAVADGITLKATSSFRTNDNQISLCSTNPDCSSGTSYRLVAKPGFSSHESGSAIDFANMRDGETGGQTCATRDKPNTEEWRWMLANADEYGYLQYSKEGWHWDTRPELSNRCDSSEV